MKIISFDPGGTTGVAIFNGVFPLNEFGPPSIETLQLGPQEHHAELFKMLLDEAPDVVVCESFIARQIAKNNLEPVEYIGIIKLWQRSWLGNKLVFQTPSQAKGLWPDRKLQDLELLERGQRHSNDAIRHLLYYITVTMKDEWFLR